MPVPQQRGMMKDSSFVDSLPPEDILSFYKTTAQVQQDNKQWQRSPEVLAQMYPQLGALYKKEGSDGLSILAPLRPMFRGLERLTFNVGYACLGGFALGSVSGFARMVPHSQQGLSMGESVTTVLRRSLRVAREEGASGLRRWGSIVTLHSLLEAAARYALWTAHQKEEALPAPVMMSDDISPQQAMMAMIKEPARKAMENYDVANMKWNAGINAYPFASKLFKYPVEDSRVIPVWTALPLMMLRTGLQWNTAPRRPMLLSLVAYPTVVYFWQTRMPGDAYMDVHEEYVPDESMQPMF